MKKLVSIVFFFLLNFVTIAQENCNNGLDDDGNGFIDCEDAACVSTSSCPAFSLPAVCPPGGSIGRLIFSESKYRSISDNTATTFTVPSGTELIRVSAYGINQKSGTSTLEDRLDEDYLMVQSFFNVADLKSNGIVNLSTHAASNGLKKKTRIWNDCPNGEFVNGFLVAPALIGLPTNVNNFKFTLTGNQFSIVETNSNVQYRLQMVILVEYYSGSMNALQLRDMRKSYFKKTSASRNSLNIPAGVKYAIVNIKGYENYDEAPFQYPGTDETWLNGRVIIDLNTNKKVGIVTCSAGSGVMNGTSLVFNNLSAQDSSWLKDVSTGDIQGIFVDPDTSPLETALYGGAIFVQGSNLIIKELPNYQKGYGTIYEVEFYEIINQPLNIKQEIRSFITPKNSGSGAYTTNVVDVPFGTRRIEVYQSGVIATGVNGEEWNENPFETYSLINVSNQRSSGFMYLNVNQDHQYEYVYTDKLAQNFASTRFGSWGETGPNNTNADLQFDLTGDSLYVRNRFPTHAGINGANSAEFITYIVFYVSQLDAGNPFPSTTQVSRTNYCNYNLTTSICNQGGVVIPAGFPVSVYKGNPFASASAVLLAVSNVGTNVLPGKCLPKTIPLVLGNFAYQPIDLYVVIGDNGSEVAGGVGQTIGLPLLTSGNLQSNGNFEDCNVSNNVVMLSVLPACSSLPVELTEFAASVCGENVCLRWETQSETSSSHFDISRSKSLSDWEYVGKVTAAGNSEGKLVYQTEDFNPYNGISYYKLDQYDLNGMLRESQVRSVEYEADLIVSPNPFDQELVVLFEDQTEHTLEIIDVNGKTLYKTTSEKSEIISTADYPQGVYMLVVDDTIVKRLIKVK